jgi:3-oxoacyl-[acyl-carrier-protein] synthase-1
LFRGYVAEDPELGNVSLEDFVLPSGEWKADCEKLAKRLLNSCETEIPEDNCRICFGGHAGVATVLRDAVEQMANGVIDRCIVGGIDSCVEPRYLQAAASLRLVRTGVNPVGFLPGEAAAFLLVEKVGRNDTEKLNRPAWGLNGITLGKESFHRLDEHPPQGAALAHVIEELVARLDRDPSPGQIIVDLNGEDYRAADGG